MLSRLLVSPETEEADISSFDRATDHLILRASAREEICTHTDPIEGISTVTRTLGSESSTPAAIRIQCYGKCLINTSNK